MASDGERVFDSFRLDSAGRQLWQGPGAVPLRPKLFAAAAALRKDDRPRMPTWGRCLRGRPRHTRSGRACRSSTDG